MPRCVVVVVISPRSNNPDLTDSWPKPFPSICSQHSFIHVVHIFPSWSYPFLESIQQHLSGEWKWSYFKGFSYLPCWSWVMKGLLFRHQGGISLITGHFVCHSADSVNIQPLNKFIYSKRRYIFSYYEFYYSSSVQSSSAQSSSAQSQLNSKPAQLSSIQLSSAQCSSAQPIST